MHLAHWNEDQSIPDRLPLLDQWMELQNGALPLKGMTVLFIQHQLGNQVPQAMAMMQLGVAPEDFWWLDIPYTSSPPVRARLVERGFLPGNFFPGEYKALEPYCPYQRKRTQAALQSLQRSVRGKLLVIDDGSYFLAVSPLTGLRHRSNCFAVMKRRKNGFPLSRSATSEPNACR